VVADNFNVRQTPMSFLTPQKKKELSYKLDRRNDFDGSSKAGRKLVPLRKQLERQNDRRVAKQIIPNALIASDLLADDSVENRIAVHEAKKKRTRWRKTRDIPLGEKLSQRRRVAARRATVPNQSMDPTSSSGTPLAEPESRHP
jgi:adenine-specific DNA methylase